MTFVIILVVVLVVGGLVAKFYPKSKPTTTEPSILDRVKAIEKDIETVVEHVTAEVKEVIEEAETITAKKTKAPKTDAKPKRTKKQNKV